MCWKYPPSMSSFINHKLNIRNKMYFIAAIAMLVRALVPTGWMYTPDADNGHLTIQVCGGHWVNWNPDTGQTSKIENSDNQQHDNDVELASECPYGLTAQAIIALDNNYSISQSVWASTTISRPSTGPPVDRSNQVKLPARGPPHSV